jgi:hypothetical protein
MEVFMALLRQNRELKRLGIWNWSLPAYAGTLPDGRNYNTCPSAGVCASACYARNGTFLYPVVRRRHHENLRYVLDDLPGWTLQMQQELGHHRFRDRWVRIHDSGDFFSEDYLAAWIEIIRNRPATNFYAYTKEVAAFRLHVEPDPPSNFRWVYSYGGTQDSSLDQEFDRVADVLPDETAITQSGWHSQASSDLLAVLGPAPVGIPANNITRFKAVQAGRRWSAWQAATDAARRERVERAHARAKATHAEDLPPATAESHQYPQHGPAEP